MHSESVRGYGDIYPQTGIGRLVGVLSSFMGIAIVALPTGIITAGYMEMLHSNAVLSTDETENAKNKQA